MLIDTSIGYSKPKPIGVWSKEEDRCLRALWLEGKTAAQIERMIGRSRNAVIGRAHRLNLERRENPCPPKVKFGFDPKSGRIYPKYTTTHKRKLGHQEKPEKTYTLSDLGMNMCRFPFGEKTPYSFCGRTTDGKHYCAEHIALCYEPRRKK